MKLSSLLCVANCANYHSHLSRTEPKCITCNMHKYMDDQTYYDNCSHFEAYVIPKSSSSTDVGVEYYILECRGPSLPFAGEFLLLSIACENLC